MTRPMLTMTERLTARLDSVSARAAAARSIIERFRARLITARRTAAYLDISVQMMYFYLTGVHVPPRRRLAQMVKWEYLIGQRELTGPRISRQSTLMHWRRLVALAPPARVCALLGVTPARVAAWHRGESLPRAYMRTRFRHAHIILSGRVQRSTRSHTSTDKND